MRVNLETISLDLPNPSRSTADSEAGIRIALAHRQEPHHPNRHERRRAQSLAVRQLLADTLTHHWGADQASRWTLLSSATGQPFLQGAQPPSVSLTHAGPWVACAVGRTSLVGIDVEPLKIRDWTSVAPWALHPLEQPWVLEGSPETQSRNGLLCWCRKEALCKALGVGVDVSASKIAFSEQGKLLTLPSDMGATADWRVDGWIHNEQVVIAAAWR